MSSLTLVHGQSFAQCALGFFKIKKNNDFVNNVLGRTFGKKWMKNTVAFNTGIAPMLDHA
jgi:hypothetical protein